MGRESRKSERTIREPKKIVLSLSKKNIVIRAIIAGTCLILGALLIAHSCSNMGDKTGDLTINYPTFTNKNSETQVLFDNNIDVNYYYSDDTSDKEEVVNKINNSLNEMIEYHKLLDYNDLYQNNGTDIHNLKYINDHPNVWIKVDLKLFNVLKMAEELRNNTDGKYSIFSGKLYEAWANIIDDYYMFGMNLDTIKSIDPLYNEDIQHKINDIVNSINKENTKIEFNDNTQEVKFVVLDEDKKNIVLDLGLLESSYLIDNLKSRMMSEKLYNGTITSSTGMVATLGDNVEKGYHQINSVSLQSVYNNSLIFDYSFAYYGARNGMIFNPFLEIKFHSYLSNKSPYYYFFDNNNIVIRSLIINSKSGYSDFSVHSSFIYSSELTLSNQLVDNYNLYFNQENDYGYNYLLKYENSNKTGAIVIYNNGNNNIGINSATTLLYSTLMNDYFDEKYIPYIKVSKVVKTKIVATKGD